MSTSLEWNGPEFYSWLNLNVPLYNDFHFTLFHPRKRISSAQSIKEKVNVFVMVANVLGGENKEIIIIVIIINERFFTCVESLLHRHTKWTPSGDVFRRMHVIQLPQFEVIFRAPPLTFLSPLYSSSWKHETFVEFDLILNLRKFRCEILHQLSPLAPPHTPCSSPHEKKTFTLRMIV